MPVPVPYREVPGLPTRAQVALAQNFDKLATLPRTYADSLGAQTAVPADGVNLITLIVPVPGGAEVLIHGHIDTELSADNIEPVTGIGRLVVETPHGITKTQAEEIIFRVQTDHTARATVGQTWRPFLRNEGTYKFTLRAIRSGGPNNNAFLANPTHTTLVIEVL